jgi:hypothetical protein
MSRSGTEWVSDVKWIKRWATAVRDIAKADAHAAKRQTDAAPGKAGEVLGEYATLHNYLAKRYANIVLLTFDQIEGLLGFRLPDSAPTRQEWWAETCRDGTRDEPSCSDAWVLAGMNGETESVGPDKQHPRRAHLASLFAEVLHSR